MCHHRICPEVLVHIRASLPLGCGRPRKPSAMTRQTVVAGVRLRGSFRRLHRQSTTGAESVWATRTSPAVLASRCPLSLSPVAASVARSFWDCLQPATLSFRQCLAHNDAAKKESAATRLRNASRLGPLDWWLGLFTFSRKPEWTEDIQRSHARQCQGESSKGYRITVRERRQ